MSIVSLDDIIELRKEVLTKFNAKVHVHDTCPAQAFSLDEPNLEVCNYITEYFNKKGLRAVFSDDGVNFMVKEFE